MSSLVCVIILNIMTPSLKIFAANSIKHWFSIIDCIAWVTCLCEWLQSTTVRYISDVSLGYKHKSLTLLLSLASLGFISIHWYIGIYGSVVVLVPRCLLMPVVHTTSVRHPYPQKTYWFEIERSKYLQQTLGDL